MKTTTFTRLSTGLVFLFMLVSVHMVAQTELWGMTSQGATGYGSIFKLKTDGSGFANFVFENQGANPTGDLLESGGKFYGMTPYGGSKGDGVLFEYDPAGAGTYTVNHHFDDANGSNAQGSLIASGGKFYGMTQNGGAYGWGVLFEYDPAGGGTYTVKYHFDEATGRNPYRSLLEFGGKIYGMTPIGGSNGKGVLFEYDPAGGGTYTVKHHFDEATGDGPFGNLMESGGKFYGMTQDGGSNGYGVLFEYDPAGAGIYTVKHHFDFANGGLPRGSLLESGGKFYGMTSLGGSSGDGVLFEYDPAGAGIYTVKHHFFGVFNNGNNPQGSLIESGGKFYGVTLLGWDGGVVLFEYDPANGGAYTIKHHFDGDNGGYPFHPIGSLITSGGKFYGMAFSGGSGGIGVLFEYDPAGTGTYTVKHHFDFANGGGPQGSLIESGGKFYGMTFYGGGSGGYGVLFEYDPANGGTYSVKHHFDLANGGGPQGSLIESGGKFYGMTSYGGVLFEYDPAGTGTYTVKHHFDGINGSLPRGSLLESGGKFYGMTSSGGSSFDGVLFEYDPAGAGTYSVKHHFDGTNGGGPRGSLLESGGKFYGMTEYGGSNEFGVLFEYDPTNGGTYTVKHHFDGTNGRLPRGSLLESGGKFYGMTYDGGNNGDGVLFEYNPAGAGTYTVKHHFEGDNGGYPSGSLMESGGKFYGMTSYGGGVFEFDPAGDGTYTVLRHLENADGTGPFGDLIAVTLVNTTSPAEGQSFEMQVFPNPAGSYLNIHLPVPGVGLLDILVFDAQGRLLRRQPLFADQPLDIQWLVPGVYLLKVVEGGRVFAGKFVKQ